MDAIELVCPECTIKHTVEVREFNLKPDFGKTCDE